MRWSLLLSIAGFCLVLQLPRASATALPHPTTIPDWEPLSRRGGGAAAPPVAADDSGMPTLFSPEESQFDRYAACLAATEGLRRMRDKALSEHKKGGGKNQSEEQQRIATEYAHKSSDVLKAMGMTVPQFNMLGRQISQDEKLKEKVMEQAYLYRMAATLHLERIPLVDDPASKQLLESTPRRKRLELFCDSMVEIEQLRADQMERLKKSLHVDKLPAGIQLSDPNILPFLSPKVRAVAEAFPLQAEEIVKKHGLQSDEFNAMLEQTKSNPMFRWQVEHEIKKGQQGGEEQKKVEASKKEKTKAKKAAKAQPTQ